MATDPQFTKNELFNGVGKFKKGRKLNVYYFGFKICDLDALESMRVLFESIKTAIWPDQERYPLVYRSKFNANFKNINLWAADFGILHHKRLKNAFGEFTEDLAGELDGVRIKFSDITCESNKGKTYVRLKPGSESQGTFRRLQSELIYRFSEYQRPGFVKLYDPSCHLLYLDSETPSEDIENIVRQCFRELGRFEARLEPFILCHDREVLFEYPESSPADFKVKNKTPEWVARSLFIYNMSYSYRTDPRKIIAALADLVGFELKQDTVESCDPKIGYYTPGHIKKLVAVFRTISLRDSFILSVKRYLKDNDWQILACDAIEGFPRHLIYVFKALPAMEDELLDLARVICKSSLQDYRASVDGSTLAFYLEQRDVPRWQYYFKTREELFDLVNLLKYGTGTEYLSSVW